MRLHCFLGILFLLSAYAAAANPEIDALAARFSKNPLWMNGTYPKLDLKADASADQVVERCLKMTSFDAGRIKRYEIIATEEVVIPPLEQQPRKPLAVLINSDLGQKIILMQFRGKDWWTRVFRAE